jgi:hypothetical protein
VQRRPMTNFVTIVSNNFVTRETAVFLKSVDSSDHMAEGGRKARAGGWVHAVAVICQRTAGCARQHTTREVAVVSCCTSAGGASTLGPEPGRGLGQSSRDPQLTSGGKGV